MAGDVLTLRDGAKAAGVPWETLRTWIKRGWVILPETTTTGGALVPGAVRSLNAESIHDLAVTRDLISIGVHPREAWRVAAALDLGTLADLGHAVTLAARVREAVYQKGTSAMPGVNFKPEYVAPILDGSKPFTLRKRRKDGREAAMHARLMLFTGMRTKDCRKFAETTVIARATIAFRETGMVSVFHDAVNIPKDVGSAFEMDAVKAAADRLYFEVIGDMKAAARFPNGPQTAERLERIAAWDGFASWAAMWEFHKGQGLDMDGNAVRELFGFGVIEPVTDEAAT